MPKGRQRRFRVGVEIVGSDPIHPPRRWFEDRVGVGRAFVDEEHHDVARNEARQGHPRSPGVREDIVTRCEGAIDASAQCGTGENDPVAHTGRRPSEACE